MKKNKNKIIIRYNKNNDNNIYYPKHLAFKLIEHDSEEVKDIKQINFLKKNYVYYTSLNKLYKYNKVLNFTQFLPLKSNKKSTTSK